VENNSSDKIRLLSVKTYSLAGCSRISAALDSHSDHAVKICVRVRACRIINTAPLRLPTPKAHTNLIFEDYTEEFFLIDNSEYCVHQKMFV
jgi:hypothetical protein